jgi:hypothetical protein
MRRDFIVVIIVGGGWRNGHRQDHYDENSCSTQPRINTRDSWSLLNARTTSTASQIEAVG